MQIVLPPELEQLVQRQIDSGHYQTAVEVLLAGVRLLNDQSCQTEDSSEQFGELDQNLQFVALTETEMIRQSVEVLATYPQDGIPHNQVEAWVESLGTEFCTTAFEKTRF